MFKDQKAVARGIGRVDRIAKDVPRRLDIILVCPIKGIQARDNYVVAKIIHDTLAHVVAIKVWRPHVAVLQKQRKVSHLELHSLGIVQVEGTGLTLGRPQSQI